MSRDSIADGSAEPSEDGSADPNSEEQHSRGVRLAFLAAGHLCLGLAVVGILLPVMPGTVFLLAAAACYARGSRKFYAWLLAHRWLGPPIHDWRRHRAMSVQAKIIAITSVLVGVGISTVFFVRAPWLRLALAAVAVGVTATILLIRTRKA